MKLNKYIWIAALPMLVSACQNDELNEGMLPADGVYTLSGKMGGSAALSRAQIQLGNEESGNGEMFFWNSDDSFKLYQMVNGELNTTEFTISSDYTEPTQGSQTSASFHATIPAYSGVNYVAIYPGNVPVDEENNALCNLQRELDFTNATTAEQKAAVWTEYFKNNMFMMATGRLTAEGTNTVTFKHLCALARVTYTNATDQEQVVEGIRLGGDQFFGDRFSYRVSGGAQGSGASNGYDVKTKGLKVAAGESMDFYLFFYPRDFNEGEMHLTVMEKGHLALETAKISAANNGAQGFEAGKRYWFKVVQTADGMAWNKDMNLKAATLLFNSIFAAQQDPHVAERIFVYNWASAARISGENTSFLTAGRYSDSYNTDYHNSYIAQWIKNASEAIRIADNSSLYTGDVQVLAMNANIKAFARIWRAVMLAEYSDNFGPCPLGGYDSESPTYNTVQEVYYHILSELKEAVEAIDESVVPTEEVAELDPMFGYNAGQWKRLANSLRLRYAMRLSECDTNKAKTEFEAVSKDLLITSLANMAQVAEQSLWNPYDGVYSRSWNYISLSSSMSNILTGLGGVAVSAQRSDLAAYTKPMNYLGLKYNEHYPTATDNPTKYFWMDGIPEQLDPRALRLFCLPNDQNADNFIDYGSTSNHYSYGMKDISGNVIEYLDAQYTWNAYPAGARTVWSNNFARNLIASAYPYVLPVLSKTFGGKSEGSRVWFGPWETYFLLAEAALYGWNTGGMSAQDAYEQGIRSSFEYFGVSQYVDAYLNSTAYNRIGTSVKFTHTDEPTGFAANYVDGYSKQTQAMTYQYPDAAKGLYKGKKLNDALSKIITQKYIAQAPYGALEIWNDRRRLGLPWFEMPNNDATFTGADMEHTWTPETYMSKQRVEVFPQRLRYPSGLKNAGEALQKLGGENTTLTPLWWAIDNSNGGASLPSWGIENLGDN